LTLHVAPHNSISMHDKQRRTGLRSEKIPCFFGRSPPSHDPTPFTEGPGPRRLPPRPRPPCRRTWGGPQIPGAGGVLPPDPRPPALPGGRHGAPVGTRAPPSTPRGVPRDRRRGRPAAAVVGAVSRGAAAARAAPRRSPRRAGCVCLRVVALLWRSLFVARPSPFCLSSAACPTATAGAHRRAGWPPCAARLCLELCGGRAAGAAR